MSSVVCVLRRKRYSRERALSGLPTRRSEEHKSELPLPPISTLFPYTTLFRSHLVVRDVRIVDVERGLRLAQEAIQPRARALGADDQVADARRVVRAVGVGLEQAQQLLDDARRPGDDTETAALDVLPGVVEAEDERRAAIDDQHLAVIAHHVVVRAVDGDALLQHALFELAQALFAALVRVRDERDDFDAALDRGGQRLLELVEVETEDDDGHPPLRPFHGGEQPLYALIGLRDQFHAKT